MLEPATKRVLLRSILLGLLLLNVPLVASGLCSLIGIGTGQRRSISERHEAVVRDFTTIAQAGTDQEVRPTSRRPRIVSRHDASRLIAKRFQYVASGDGVIVYSRSPLDPGLIKLIEDSARSADALVRSIFPTRGSRVVGEMMFVVDQTTSEFELEHTIRDIFDSAGLQFGSQHETLPSNRARYVREIGVVFLPELHAGACGVVVHEFVHALVWELGVRLPECLEEGLAELVADSLSPEPRVDLSAANLPIGLLRSRCSRLRELADSGALWGLDQVLELKTNDFSKGASSQQAYDQSATLVSFLVVHDGLRQISQSPHRDWGLESWWRTERQTSRREEQSPHESLSGAYGDFVRALVGRARLLDSR